MPIMEGPLAGESANVAPADVTSVQSTTGHDLSFERNMPALWVLTAMAIFALSHFRQVLCMEERVDRYRWMWAVPWILKKRNAHRC